MAERSVTAPHGLDPATQRRAVRERYGAIARSGSMAEHGTDSGRSCCGSRTDGPPRKGCSVLADEPLDGSGADYVSMLGYTDDDLEGVAAGPNLTLGCGNPTAIASLAAGETVLDLGSGAGFDCFLAARAVGPTGRVIGVDMTPEMVERARENARRNGIASVEFRLGEIEHLPVAETSVDVVISNCVVNLSPDQPQVYREAFRVLRPGGRLSIADVVRRREIPEARLDDPASVSGCIAGAASASEIRAMLHSAGFVDVDIETVADSDEIVKDWDAETALDAFVVNAQTTATKPVG